MFADIVSVLWFFLFTALPGDQAQAFCISALHCAVVPCDSTAFLLRYASGHTDRHADRNTSHPPGGEVNIMLLIQMLQQSCRSQVQFIPTRTVQVQIHN